LLKTKERRRGGRHPEGGTKIFGEEGRIFYFFYWEDGLA
jgi:hypothetical protein